MKNGATTYRADIDGLRSIAILAVVINHALPALLPGGFVGVDVFFVISGFLITGILLEQSSRQQFSILHFYERRARRILPAFFVVTASSLVAGYIFLYPADYKDLARSALWATGFSSNIYFFNNTGYFDAAAEMMPLLHTWSLGVEEQFYLLWPIFILFVWNASSSKSKSYWIIFLLFLLSFISCVYLSYLSPNTAFYLSPTRFWELLTGALLAFSAPFIKDHTLPKPLILILPCCGLLLIIISLFFLTDNDVFPGYLATMPVLGCAFLIFAGMIGTNPVSALLSTRLPVFFGKISYSLYLWHWPLIVFYRHYITASPLTALEASSLIILSAVIAYLSWRFVEQPFRNTASATRTVFISAAIGIVMIVIIAGIISGMNGFPNRLPKEALKLTDRAAMTEWKCPEKLTLPGLTRRCFLGAAWNSAAHKAVLWGDSHAIHYAPLVNIAARKAGISVMLYDSCSAIIDNRRIFRTHSKIPSYSEKCQQEHDALLQYLDADTDIDLVILAAMWSSLPTLIHSNAQTQAPLSGLSLLHQGMVDTIDDINLKKRNVLILTEIPAPRTDLIPCVLQSFGGVMRDKQCDTDTTRIDINTVKKWQDPTNEVLLSLTKISPKVRVVNSTRLLCDITGCNTYVNGEFIYRDHDHLRKNLKIETYQVLIDTIGLQQALENSMPARLP